jgi:hypothetical protein
MVSVLTLMWYSSREKYQHHYYDDEITETLARYFKVDEHSEMLTLLKQFRKDGY